MDKTFEADFFELPDGTVTVVIRADWRSSDDALEVLKRSTRRDPRRADGSFVRDLENWGSVC